MIITRIPHQAKIIQAANIFTAEFNAVDGIPTGTGQYDFNQLINQRQPVIELLQNAVYLIDTVNVGGDLSEENYLESIDTRPAAVLLRSKTGETVYTKPIPIVNYIDNQGLTAWLVSDKAGEFMQISFSGVLNQIAATVGRQFLNIEISLNIYQLDSALYNNSFRNDEKNPYGEFLRQ